MRANKKTRPIRGAGRDAIRLGDHDLSRACCEAAVPKIAAPTAGRRTPCLRRVRYWIADEREVPTGVAMLLNLMISTGTAAEKLRVK